jgi:hypothetical protein
MVLAIPEPRLWTPGTSRAAMPAIFSTTSSAMLVRPRLSGATEVPLCPWPGRSDLSVPPEAVWAALRLIVSVMGLS